MGGGSDRFSPAIYLMKTGQSAVTIDESRILIDTIFLTEKGYSKSVYIFEKLLGEGERISIGGGGGTGRGG